jgi:deoxyadenosine/deoxycytidine kinase
MAKPYITISGPIGAGKSTFAAYLSKHLGYPCFLESAGERNPFLESFYLNRKKYAFRSQAFFLLEALHQEQIINSLSDGAIQDRSHWEHIQIFIKSLVEDNFLSSDEQQLLNSIAAVGGNSISQPDLMIYLETTPQLLKQRVSLRGRSYEKSLNQSDFKKSINDYQQWIEQWSGDTLTIEANDIDYQDQEQMKKILAIVQERLKHV